MIGTIQATLISARPSKFISKTDGRTVEFYSLTLMDENNFKDMDKLFMVSITEEEWSRLKLDDKDVLAKLVNQRYDFTGKWQKRDGKFSFKVDQIRSLKSS